MKKYTHNILRCGELIIIFIILIIFLENCARIHPLKGGLKDTIPPTLLDTYPNTTNNLSFNDQHISLTFDKEIEVRNLDKELIITPRLKKKYNKPSYTFKNKKYTIYINLTNRLEDSTTYTFNFRKAITDVTERNQAVNPTVVLSTSNYIDSLSVKGNIQYLLTRLPGKNALVALYSTKYDSLHILNSNPDYFTYADKEGNFELLNIKSGEYKIYAGINKNKELILDSEKNFYGFKKDPVTLKQSIKDLTLYVFKGNVKDFKLKYKRPQGQYFEICFNKPIIEYTLDLIKKPRKFRKIPRLYSIPVENNKVIRVYNTLKLIDEDSIYARLLAKDILGNVIEDTVTIHFRESNRKKERVRIRLKKKIGTTQEPFFHGNFGFNKPIENIILDSIYFKIDSVDTIPITLENVTFSKHRDSVTINKYFDVLKHDYNNKKIILHAGKGSFITIEKDSSQQIEQQYLLPHTKELGSIKGFVKTNNLFFTVQLLDKYYRVIDEIKHKKSYIFKNISPGKYWIRVLLLQSKNASWCFGNINNNQEPDKVMIHPDQITVLANWEIKDINFEF